MRFLLQESSTSSRPLFFDSEGRKQFLEKFQDSNSFVAKKYFDRKELFSDDTPQGVVNNDGEINSKDIIIAYGNALADHRTNIRDLTGRIHQLELLLITLAERLGQ